MVARTSGVHNRKQGQSTKAPAQSSSIPGCPARTHGADVPDFLALINDSLHECVGMCIVYGMSVCEWDGSYTEMRQSLAGGVRASDKRKQSSFGSRLSCIHEKDQPQEAGTFQSVRVIIYHGSARDNYKPTGAPQQVLYPAGPAV